MANFNGTVVIPGKGGELEARSSGVGKRTFAAGIANTDTITITGAGGLFPRNRKIRILGGRVWGIEVDTNATPTGLFTIGTAADADGFLTSKGLAVGLQNSLAGQLNYVFDGELIGTTIDPTDLILTVTAAVATSATSGDLWFQVDYENVM